MTDSKLTPFSVALVVDSAYMRSGLFRGVAKWRGLVELKIYASGKEVKRALENRDCTHDIWLIDVSLKRGRPEAVLDEVKKRSRRPSSQTSVWLYSFERERLVPHFGVSRPVFDHHAGGEDPWAVVCNGIESIRGRWIDRISESEDFDLNEPTSVVEVPERGLMTLAQVYADLCISAEKDEWPSLLKAAYGREPGLMRYYRAFAVDPSASHECGIL